MSPPSKEYLKKTFLETFSLLKEGIPVVTVDEFVLFFLIFSEKGIFFSTKIIRKNFYIFSHLEKKSRYFWEKLALLLSSQPFFNFW